jgi:hypothetical protein
MIYEDKIKVRKNDLNNSLETTLTGQSGYSEDIGAFMLNDDLMVICTGDDGPNYMTKQQAMEMFNLMEKPGV